MTRLEALQYIRNTNGGATSLNFIIDWEPVGGIEWDLLTSSGLAHEVNDRIFLTELGQEQLANLEAK